MNALFHVQYLEKNSDPEYYNKEIKQLKSKVRKAYNRRKLGVHYLEDLKQLSKQLLVIPLLSLRAFVAYERVKPTQVQIFFAARLDITIMNAF